MTRRQCKACPWKISTVPDQDIPGGYCSTKHENLRSTIAEQARVPIPGTPLRLMACHETTGGNELACVGWLEHQLGRGNNIALRLAASRDPSLADYELDGPQHETFEDTLPEASS